MIGMSAATPLCTKCHRPLALIRPPKIRARLSKATFISLNIPPPTPPKFPGSNANAGTNVLDDTSVSTGSGERPRRRRLPANPINPRPGDFLESIFEETLASQREPEELQSQVIKSLGPYKHAEGLKRVLAENASPVEPWNFFVKHFGSNVGRKDNDTIRERPLPAYVHSAAKQLLRRIISAKLEAPFSGTLPSATEVSTLYAKLGLLCGDDWADMMLNIVREVLKIRQADPRDIDREETLLLDLLGAWNVVCRRLKYAVDFPLPDSPSLDWSKLPFVSTKDITSMYAKYGAMSAFGLLTPSFRRRDIENIPIIAIATFTLLTKKCPVGKTVLLESSLFISKLRDVIRAHGYDTSQLKRVNDGSALGIVSEFSMQELPWLDLTHIAAAHLDRKATHTRQAPFIRRIGIHNRIQDALGKRDATQLDRLWEDVVCLPISQPDMDVDFSNLSTGHEPGALSISLCNYFILAYMTLRKPNSAISVWNHMINSNLIPTMKTWNAMLGGCRASKDRNALEAVWEKLQQSGLTPDAGCWTTRIIGLIECGRANDGLRALDDMGQTWLSAVKSKHGKVHLDDDVPGATKPTTETINAVIAGLLRNRRPKAIRLVVSWSTKFGIQPNIVTYNTLLRHLIRDGKSNEIVILLKQMQKAGVEADVVTYTTLIEEIFQPSESTTPREQRQSILAILSEMEAAGIKANLHTYGKIINQILRVPHEDFTAVNAVLERMALHGLQPSSYIYTMLVEHYFNRETPDLGAAKSLIQRAQLQPGSTDHIFWGRVVEGFARAGDTASAMRVLTELDRGQNIVGWVALRTLLSALTQNQEWDVARTLVGNTRASRGGPLSKDEHGMEGQHSFWALAAELQLL